MTERSRSAHTEPGRLAGDNGRHLSFESPSNAGITCLPTPLCVDTKLWLASGRDAPQPPQHPSLVQGLSSADQPSATQTVAEVGRILFEL